MKIDKEKLIELKREGKTNVECAKVFGCSAQAVREAVLRLEAEGRLTPADSVKATEYVEEKHLQTDEKPVTKTVAEYLAEEEAAEAVKEAEFLAERVKLPPAPPINRKTFWDMRRDELRGAICEYACYGLRIDPEWVEEYNELIGRCGG